MAIAWVANATSSNTNGVATTGSLGATEAGQLIVITICDDSALATSVTSVTDTYSNTWTQIPIPEGSSGVMLSTFSLQMWYAVVATGKAGATHNVTVNWSTVATGRVTVAASYFNGFTSAPTLDLCHGALGTGTTASSPASGTTTTGNELIVGGFGHGGTASAFSLSGGYSNLATVNVANAAVAQESLVTSVRASYITSATIALSRAWGAVVATFKDGPSSDSTALFGQLTPGASSTLHNTNRKTLSQTTLSSAGTLNSLTIRALASNTTETKHMKGVIYADNAGAPGSLLFTTSEVAFSNTAVSYITAPFADESISAGTYWIGAIYDGNATTSVTVYRGNTASSARSATDTYSDGPANPAGTLAALNGPLDAFVVYEPIGGGSNGQAKVYNGSAFVAKPAKVYNGSTWVIKPVKQWNGSAWVATTY